MTRVETALERLGAAVERLEETGLARIEEWSNGGDADQIERLSSELKAVRSEYQALQLTSHQASGRIDAAIGRLRAVLEA